MNASRYYSLIVVDIENWGGRPGLAQSRMQNSLRRILHDSMSEAGVPEVGVRFAPRGDGFIVVVPADVPKEVITADLVRALNRGLRIHDDECDPDENMRLRVGLHAGDIDDRGGDWAGHAVVLACRLVGSDVAHRVLTAASSAVLTVIVSESWFDSVLREGWADRTGYDPVFPKVKDYAGRAWIRVPGQLHPPGLLKVDMAPSDSVDEPGEPRGPRARAAAVTQSVVIKHGADHSITHNGNGPVYGGNSGGTQNYGLPPQEQRS